MRGGQRLPAGLDEEVERARRARSRSSAGKRFGDRDDPLLVSVRSGAAVSMPGMMDTILNLGLNDEAVEGLAETTGNRALRLRLVPAADPDVRRGRSTASTRTASSRRSPTLKRERGVEQDVDLDADDLRELVGTLQGDLRGGDRPRRSRRTRASSSRGRSRPSSTRGTRRARRCTAARTRSPTTSAPPSTSSRWSSATRARPRRPASRSRATRRPASRASSASSSSTRRARTSSPGIRTPSRSTQMEDVLPGGVRAARRDDPRALEEHYRDMQDVEFTVEEGTLYLLQTRTAKRTAAAALQGGRRHGRRGADLARGGGRADRPGAARPAAPPDARPGRAARGRREGAERLARARRAARSSSTPTPRRRAARRARA